MKHWILLGYFDQTKIIFFNPTKNIKIIIKYLKNNINITDLQDNDGVNLVEQHEDGVVNPEMISKHEIGEWNAIVAE